MTSPSAADAKNRLLCAPLLAFVLVLNSCSVQTPTLALSILTDKREYRMGDVLRLETRFSNTGTQTFYLFDDLCWNPGNLLNIHTFNGSGKEVSGHSDFLRDCLPPPPRPDDTSRFIQLEPGAFEASAEKFDIRELVPEPGQYDLLVYYHSGISKKWISEYGGPKLDALTIAVHFPMLMLGVSTGTHFTGYPVYQDLGVARLRFCETRYTHFGWQGHVCRSDRAFSCPERAARRCVATILSRCERSTNTPMAVIFRGSCPVAGKRRNFVGVGFLLLLVSQWRKSTRHVAVPWHLEVHWSHCFLYVLSEYPSDFLRKG